MIQAFVALAASKHKHTGDVGSRIFGVGKRNFLSRNKTADTYTHDPHALGTYKVTTGLLLNQIAKSWE